MIQTRTCHVEGAVSQVEAFVTESENTGWAVTEMIPDLIRTSGHNGASTRRVRSWWIILSREVESYVSISPPPRPEPRPSPSRTEY